MKQYANPLALMAAHQKVGQEDADSIALPVLLHLDAAKRGVGTTDTANFLTKHILISLHLGSKAGNRALYDMAGAAYNALRSACLRPVEEVSFTTGEYKAMRAWVGAYLKLMPHVKVGLMNLACAQAAKALERLEQMEPEAA